MTARTGRTITVTSSQEMVGKVTWTDGMRIEIAVGQPPKPEAKLYVDGNPLHLAIGEKVVLNVRRG